MAIDTYAKLQTEILDTLDRDDLVADVTGYTPGTIEGAVKRAISKAERRIARRLKTKEFETSTAFSTAAGVETIAVPADFVMVKLLMLTSNPVKVLDSKDLSTLYGDTPSSTPGIPSAYAAFGDDLYLRPIPDSARTAKLFYYAVPNPLSDTNTSNAFLTKYPDLLLYGSLIELTAHMEDDERIQVWKGLFDEAAKDITNDNTLSRWSGAPITARVDLRGVI